MVIVSLSSLKARMKVRFALSRPAHVWNERSLLASARYSTAVPSIGGYPARSGRYLHTHAPTHTMHALEACIYTIHPTQGYHARTPSLTSPFPQSHLASHAHTHPVDTPPPSITFVRINKSAVCRVLPPAPEPSLGIAQYQHALRSQQVLALSFPRARLASTPPSSHSPVSRLSDFSGTRPIAQGSHAKDSNTMESTERHVSVRLTGRVAGI